jgi:predicted dehydrogenase
MSDHSSLKIGVVGLGGYGKSIISMLSANRSAQAQTGSQANQGGTAVDVATQSRVAQDHPFELTAVCSNDFDKHPEDVAKLKAMGIKLIENMDEFLAEPTAAVWLPVPIPLHRPFVEKALAAGKVVMCEKPAAGSVDDVDAMIAAREKYQLPVAIGFQDVYDKTTLPLKREILSGKFGKIKHAAIMACWPRDSGYYSRNNWAGAFKIGQSWVMDSPVNNALSHYVNLPLFLLGADEASSAKVESVEAELYRVNPIENYDTAALRLHLQGGASLLVLFTHACEQSINPRLTVEAEKGSIIRDMDHIEIITPQGSRTIPRNVEKIRPAMLQRLANLVRGLPDDAHGLATLEVARAQVLVVNAASEATAVHQLTDDQFNILKRDDGSTLHVIPGIEELFTDCARNYQMLHESGKASWTRQAGVKNNLLNYTHFAGPKQ